MPGTPFGFGLRSVCTCTVVSITPVQRLPLSSLCAIIDLCSCAVVAQCKCRRRVSAAACAQSKFHSQAVRACAVCAGAGGTVTVSEAPCPRKTVWAVSQDDTDVFIYTFSIVEPSYSSN